MLGFRKARIRDDARVRRDRCFDGRYRSRRRFAEVQTDWSDAGDRRSRRRAVGVRVGGDGYRQIVLVDAGLTVEVEVVGTAVRELAETLRQLLTKGRHRIALQLWNRRYWFTVARLVRVEAVRGAGQVVHPQRHLTLER